MPDPVTIEALARALVRTVDAYSAALKYGEAEPIENQLSLMLTAKDNLKIALDGE
jgi:hypothetical protein